MGPTPQRLRATTPPRPAGVLSGLVYVKLVTLNDGHAFYAYRQGDRLPYLADADFLNTD